MLGTNDFNFEHCKIDGTLRLQHSIVSCITESMSPETTAKMNSFLKRAFVRWIFNVVRRGKNPFADGVCINDFGEDIRRDLAYFAMRHGLPHDICDVMKYKFEGKTNIELAKSCESYNMTLQVKTSRNANGNIVIYSRGFKRFAISLTQWKALRDAYRGPMESFDDYVCLIVARYVVCGSTRNHCSMPPNVIKFSRAHLELFGSPLNACLRQYCSPFPDIEMLFGSTGSFFDFALTTGTYFMNPPFDEDLIAHAMKKIVTALQSSHEITVIAIIPVWDVVSQEQLNGRVHINRSYEALDIAKTSGYLRSRAICNHKQHQFYDYFLDAFVPVADSHLLILSNTDYHLTAFELAKKWSEVISHAKN